MTDKDVILATGSKPIDQHAGSPTRGTSTEITALDPALITDDLNKQLAKITGNFAKEIALYKNKRVTENRQDIENLRIISSAGIERVASLGLPGKPIFSYVPPSGNNIVKPLATEIKTVVMHSFGGTFDNYHIPRQGRTIPIDPVTGHNPRRFTNGVRTFLKPEAGKSIHHCVSLRGDLVNMLSWDETGQHASNLNLTGIGIEHEEWYRRGVTSEGRLIARLRGIEDRGPYSEEQYVIDAFIISKLSAYTGETYTKYLGSGLELAGNLKSKAAGCVAHAALPAATHHDPGEGFYLPPDFALGDPVTLANIPLIRKGRDSDPAEWLREWRNRLASDWYVGRIKPGTKISAYYRIFDKVNRIRNSLGIVWDINGGKEHNAANAVFDPSKRKESLTVVRPSFKRTGSAALAEMKAGTKLESLIREQQMQGGSRSSHYANAGTAKATTADAFSDGVVHLLRVIQVPTNAPVVVNAIARDPQTGEWSLGTNTTTLSTITPKITTPTTSDPKV